MSDSGSCGSGPAPSRAVAALMAALVLALCAAPATAGMNSCIPDGKDGTVAIGEQAWVCVQFNGMVQGVFNPIVDEYTQIAMLNSSNFMPPGAGFMQANVGWVPDKDGAASGAEFAITVQPVVSDTKASAAKVYKHWDAYDNVFTWPTLTAIAFVENGVVTDIAWDEGCFFCDELDPKVCQYNTWLNGTNTILQNDDYKSCISTVDDCKTSDCNLKFYLVWTGTDKHGNFLRSAGMRFSRFRAFGIEGLYNAARQEVEQDAVTVAAAASRAAEKLS